MSEDGKAEPDSMMTDGEYQSSSWDSPGGG
jgi:hypothetical protein